MRCRSILLYYTCRDLRDFSRKTDSTRRNRQMYMKARDVKKENQMKYHFSFLCKHKYKIFICWSHEIHLQLRKFGRRIILPYCKKRKVSYHIRSIFTLRGKTKVTYYILLREKQESYNITFFQTLLKTFSCGQEKQKKNIFLQEEQYVPFNEQQVLCYKSLHCRGKTKVWYYILLREEIKVSYHVLPNSPINVFLVAFVMPKLQQQWTNCKTKIQNNFPSEGGVHTFHMAFIGMLHCMQTKCF